jgi:autotransporter passenger strand-loop-strand repeat protein
MTNYTVGSGQTRTGLILGPNDTATVASGGRIIGTVDGGAITLNGGSAFGTLVENGGSIFIPGAGSITGTLIERGGTVNLGNPVGGTGTGSFTVIDGGSENLDASSSESNDLIRNGGEQFVAGGMTRNVTIDNSSEQTVLGKTFGTVVNSGGLQYVTRGNASIGVTTGTIINNGGKELLNGGISIRTVINHGGVEDVFSGAQGSIINGGTMIVEAIAETGITGVSGGIRFTGTNGVLELAGTGLTTTTISGFAPTDRIDLLNFGFSSSARASIVANNVLSIRGLTGGTTSLMLDPAANYSGDTFKLASDGHGGTNLTVQAASSGAPPTLASLQAAASAQGDPLGLRQAFTKTTPPAAHPTSAAGMTLPDPVGGSADALAMLTQAASSAHVQILANHDVVATG